MQTLFITIERDRESRSSKDGSRFRVRVAAQPDSPALLVSARTCQSVTKAKSEADTLFGALEWQDGDGDVRASAILEID